MAILRPSRRKILLQKVNEFELNILLFLFKVLLAALLDQHQAHVLSHPTNDTASRPPKLHRGLALKRYKRDWIIDTFTLQEELPGPYPILVGQVKLEGSSQLLYKLQGKGVDEDPKGLFHINEDDGSIYAHQKIDYEKTPLFQWKYNAINKTSGAVGTRLGIHLKILDINDNAPEFKNKTYYISVNENAVQGSTIHTLLAYDRDDESSPNSMVSYIMKSQTPADPNVEFTVNKEVGFISFKGCLNYEVNRNYKLVVEARDNGEKIQQSSTCEIYVTVKDKNTSPPQWTSPILATEVPENTANVTILRFGVSDGDTQNTPGWRAVYSIVEGNDDDNFEMQTDPVTNEGILNVVKPLDYEMATKNILSITVVNEEPLYSCKVIQKPNSGLWVIESGKSASSATTGTISVDVLDVNDPPKFKPETILVSLVEHSLQIGTVLATLEAKDPDIVAPNKIKYKLENDTGEWLTVDEDTGVITTRGELDRESDYVTKSKYVVKVLAIDDGEPPMTGTAILIINLKDINDNSPSLGSPYLTTCENDEEAIIVTPIVDKDLDPYSGPFYVSVLDREPDKKPLKLLNYDDDIIKVKKEKEARQGNHTIHLEIYDRQGVVSNQNLTVYVCDCLGGDVCVEKMADPPSLSGGAIALLLLAPVILLLLGLLLCKIQTAKVMVPVENEPLNSMIVYNEEAGNKDCESAAVLSDVGNIKDFSTNGTEEIDGNFHRTSTRRVVGSAAAVNKKARLHRSHSLQVQSLNGQNGNRVGASGSFDRMHRQRHSANAYGSSMQRKQMKTLETTLIKDIEELAEAVNQSPAGKAPGPDGYTTKYYKIYLSVLGPHAIKAWNTIVDTEVHDLKLYSKIWANRLAAVMSRVVHLDQKGFVLGREARDNIVRAINLIYKERTSGTPAMLLSTKAEKAFDRASRGKDVGAPQSLRRFVQKLSTHRNDTEIYKPRVYAEEGDLSRSSSLEAISIMGSISNLASLQGLGSKFNILENICEKHMNLQTTELTTQQESQLKMQQEI
ncbi:cadherin-like protein 26 [Gastrophryne carolinensis]